MRNERQQRTIYSFSCPLPCNREIRVAAENILDAIDRMIEAGAIGCRNGKHHFLCDMPHLDMPPIPEKHLKNIVSLCTQEECNAWEMSWLERKQP